MFYFMVFIHKEKFSYLSYTLSLPVSHAHTQHRHFLKQLTAHDSAKQKPKWIALIGNGQIP